MKNPLKRKPNPLEEERNRILEELKTLGPYEDEYQQTMARLNDLDKISKRSSEFTKAVIPALGTIGAVGGIYALQQFAGVLVPKALDTIASRSQQKHKELD